MLKIKAFLAISLVLITNQTALANEALSNKYTAIHKQHVLPQVQEMVRITNDQAGLDTGLVYNEGLTWEQAKIALDKMAEGISECWKNKFISKASRKQLQHAITAYESGKTQFLSKQNSAYRNAMNTCTKQSAMYLKQGVQYVINNN